MATPFRSVQDVIDYAKANPGKLNYWLGRHRLDVASRHALFNDVTGVTMRMPYSQLGGRRPTSSPAAPKSGSARSALRSATSAPARCGARGVRPGPRQAPARRADADRSRREDAEESSWYGFFAPKGTPRPIIDKVNADLEQILAMPDMKERETARLSLHRRPPDKLAAFLKAEIAKWGALAQKGAFK